MFDYCSPCPFFDNAFNTRNAVLSDAPASVAPSSLNSAYDGTMVVEREWLIFGGSDYWVLLSQAQNNAPPPVVQITSSSPPVAERQWRN